MKKKKRKAKREENQFFFHKSGPNAEGRIMRPAYISKPAQIFSYNWLLVYNSLSAAIHLYMIRDPSHSHNWLVHDLEYKISIHSNNAAASSIFKSFDKTNMLFWFSLFEKLDKF